MKKTNFALCTLHFALRRRRTAFTLVELLVVMMIIGILASMVLFAMVAAEESAKQAKTKSTITKLHNLIMPKYESYRTRRVPINISASTTPRDAAKLRLDALREIMRMEMPDRLTDISSNAINLPSRPSASNGYKAVLDSLSGETAQYQGAECLFLLVTRGLDEPDVLEQFSASEIGDTDEDGLLEFLDGWGRPIRFMRWAPAFVSPLQPMPKSATEHDQFDPLKVYANTFPLYPLIYSAGPDGIYDILSDTEPTTFSYVSPASNNNNPYLTPANTFGESGDYPTDNGVDDSGDNIHNHLIGAK